MNNCNHEWENVYNGIKCKKCGLFYPDNGNYFADPFNDESDELHDFDCTCETCLQDNPERDILYGDGEYFNWGESPIEGIAQIIFIQQKLTEWIYSAFGIHPNYFKRT